MEMALIPFTLFSANTSAFRKKMISTIHLLTSILRPYQDLHDRRQTTEHFSKQVSQTLASLAWIRLFNSPKVTFDINSEICQSLIFAKYVWWRIYQATIFIEVIHLFVDQFCKVKLFSLLIWRYKFDKTNQKDFVRSC